MKSLINNILHRKYIKKAVEVHSVPEGCVFGERPFKDGEYVICPTRLGKKALVKIKCRTPSDPGDQHFYSNELICYV